ncbi:hypothetical protein [Rhodovibrio sodomensis]|nr:hypothetical protein [Rhodovibrio sodomensis]
MAAGEAPAHGVSRVTACAGGAAMGAANNLEPNGLETDRLETDRLGR